ncbi:hypothetical protein OG21DRAFT_1491695 [Imleria badia]|nr:hypothetical protein OG21DRAFT_1491695 [Imleria badia]
MILALLFLAFPFLLATIIVVVYLATSVPASLTYSMQWSTGWWQLSVTWTDPTPSPPAEQVERPDSPHPNDNPNAHAFPDLYTSDNEGWTLHPAPPLYTLQAQDREIVDGNPGLDWDHAPAWGSTFPDTLPSQEEELPVDHPEVDL